MSYSVKAALLPIVWLAGIGLFLPPRMPALGDDRCFESAKLYGLLMSASLVCNFPERPSLGKSMAVMRESCPASVRDIDIRSIGWAALLGADGATARARKIEINPRGEKR